MRGDGDASLAARRHALDAGVHAFDDGPGPDFEFEGRTFAICYRVSSVNVRRGAVA